jgi:hypothetical protein
MTIASGAVARTRKRIGEAIIDPRVGSDSRRDSRQCGPRPQLLTCHYGLEQGAHTAQLLGSADELGTGGGDLSYPRASLAPASESSMVWSKVSRSNGFGDAWMPNLLSIS